jgi:hypothetical protein
MYTPMVCFEALVREEVNPTAAPGDLSMLEVLVHPMLDEGLLSWKLQSAALQLPHVHPS